MEVIFLPWHKKLNTDEFEAWWIGLDEEEQIDIAAVVGVLEEKGPHLPYPYSSEVKGVKYGSMRELRVKHKGKPYRILYVFDTRRAAILLIGGGKTGGAHWYEKHLPLAKKIFEQHLKDLKNE